MKLKPALPILRSQAALDAIVIDSRSDLCRKGKKLQKCPLAVKKSYTLVLAFKGNKLKFGVKFLKTRLHLAIQMCQAIEAMRALAKSQLVLQ